MALTIIPTQDYLVSEPFGIKGLAELILRNMLAQGTIVLDFEYSAASGQSLRKAAAKIKDADGFGFTCEKQGNEYREVSYPVTRTKKDGTISTVTITRRFLNVEAIRVTNLSAEADAAIAAEAAKAAEAADSQ